MPSPDVRPARRVRRKTLVPVVARLTLLTLLILLAIALPTSWAAAAGTRVPSAAWGAALSPPDLLLQAWSLLGRLWADTGCHIDPSGHCVPAAGQPVVPQGRTDEGCHLDPNGHCAPAAVRRVPKVRTDTGCNIDPGGRCTPATVRPAPKVQTDTGCHLDPGGHCAP